MEPLNATFTEPHTAFGIMLIQMLFLVQEIY